MSVPGRPMTRFQARPLVCRGNELWDTPNRGDRRLLWTPREPARTARRPIHARRARDATLLAVVPWACSLRGSVVDVLRDRFLP